jgi:hypothetical protein
MKKVHFAIAGGLVIALVFALTANLVRPQEPSCQDPRQAVAQDVADQQPPPPRIHGRGRLESKDLKLRHDGAFSRHDGRIKRLPKVTAASWDCRALGLVPPVVDQGSCGSCWDFSGVAVVTSALIKAGYGKPDGSFMLSEQYVLDCVPSGKCNGDDNTTVLARAKATGLPTTADYGAYVGRPQRCGYSSSMKLYRIADWGFCTPSQQYGVAGTQDIKNAMVQYGPIGCAVAADGSWDSYSGGIYRPSGSRNIDHDVVLVGWQDDATMREGGYWIMRNSWGRGWGEDGYMKIPYGANQIGYEAVWATANALPPPPPPPTPPPSPPPVPDLPTLTLPNGLPPGNYQLVPVPAPGTASPGQTEYGSKP